MIHDSVQCLAYRFLIYKVIQKIRSGANISKLKQELLEDFDDMGVDRSESVEFIMGFLVEARDSLFNKFNDELFDVQSDLLELISEMDAEDRQEEAGLEPDAPEGAQFIDDEEDGDDEEMNEGFEKGHEKNLKREAEKDEDEDSVPPGEGDGDEKPVDDEDK